jgi:RimJ/RimL family protein N-acetyltransferase
MFAITKRLLLRPGWVEDATDLTEALSDGRIAKNLSRMPWPYRLSDAEHYLATPSDPAYPSFQIIDRKVDPVRMIGGIGFMAGRNAPELGYWLVPDRWGHGLVVEAAKAAIAAARTSLGYTCIEAGHFADNPASGRVLQKLGFRRTGQIEKRFSLARNREVDCVVFMLTGATDYDAVSPALAA